MIYSLHLYGQPTESTLAYDRDLTPHAQGWRRSVNYLRGYNVGSFSIESNTMNATDMADLFYRIIGCHIVEKSYGMTTWEGRVQEAHLYLDGVEYVTTLDPQYWHNKVAVYYTSSLGYRGYLDWSENTDSSGIYGEMQAIMELSGGTADSAAAIQDRMLAENAWPRTRMVGQSGAGQGPSLHVTVAGYWSTLNYRYRTTDEADDADALVSTLVGESEFVTAGTVDTNTLSVFIQAYNSPRRLGDLIEFVTRQGDASGNIWTCGVYNDQELRYEAAPTTADYIWDGGLRYVNGERVLPTMAPAGIYVTNTKTPIGWPAPGTSNIWDDRRIAFLEEVEFVAPEGLEVRFAGYELALALLQEQINAGSVPGTGSTRRGGKNA